MVPSSPFSNYENVCEILTPVLYRRSLTHDLREVPIKSGRVSRLPDSQNMSLERPTFLRERVREREGVSVGVFMLREEKTFRRPRVSPFIRISQSYGSKHRPDIVG